MLDKKLIRHIVKFHASLPEDLRTTITLHPTTDHEYNNVVELMEELNLYIREDEPTRIKTSGSIFDVTFFKP